MPSSRPTAPLAPPQNCCGVSPEILLRTDVSWEGTPYQCYPPGALELTLQRVTLAPHTAVHWHMHPCPIIGYVVAGEIWVQMKDSDQQRCFVQGTAIAETVDLVHRGVTGELPAELLMFCAGTRGMAVTVEVEQAL